MQCFKWPVTLASAPAAGHGRDVGTTPPLYSSAWLAAYAQARLCLPPPHPLVVSSLAAAATAPAGLPDGERPALSPETADGPALGGPEGPPASPGLGLLDTWLLLHRPPAAGTGGGLAAELRRLSPLGRICSLKGLVTAMPLEAQCGGIRIRFRNQQRAEGGTARGPQPPALQQPDSAHQAGAGSGSSGEGGAEAGRPWHFLVDGALAFACASICDAPDAHFKFHAACVLSFCMGRILATWQALQGGDGASTTPPPAPSSSVASPNGDASGAAPEPAPAAPPVAVGRVYPAVLGPAECDMLTALLWANLEEPHAPSVRQVRLRLRLRCRASWPLPRLNAASCFLRVHLRPRLQSCCFHGCLRQQCTHAHARILPTQMHLSLSLPAVVCPPPQKKLRRCRTRLSCCWRRWPARTATA